MEKTEPDMVEAGSYDFRRLTNTELERLISQGSATWQQESELLTWAGLQQGDCVLDIGCGPGIISGLLADRVGSTGSVVGVDINEDLLSTARQLNGDRVNFFSASIYELKRFANLFDFVYVRLVCQHVARPMDAMAQILSTLKPGGSLCILDSDESILAIQPPPPDMDRLLLETQSLQEERGGDRFVGGKLAYYMRESGFVDVEPRVLLITPELIGIPAFLDSVLTWRPQLYPEALRTQSTELMIRIYAKAQSTMVAGYNGAFVVKGRRPAAWPYER